MLVIIDKTKYKIPVKKIIKVRSIQIRFPQAIGSTLTNRIPIIISGIAIIANFFHTLKTFSEKISVNSREAEINKGVAIKIEANSLKKKVLQEYS